MERNVQMIRGLRWRARPDHEGRMFQTEFTEEEARRAVEIVREELRGLMLLNGPYEEIGAGSIRKLKNMARANLELFVYGIKAEVRAEVFFSPERSNPRSWVGRYRDALVDIVAQTIDDERERYLPVYKHMLKIWPHTYSWRVVNNVLALAFERLGSVDEECIEIFANGLLRDASTWETAMNAMLSRTVDFPDEALRHFEKVLDFLVAYGESNGGSNGIQLRMDTLRHQNHPLRLAFEAQSEEVRQELRNMRKSRMVKASGIRAATQWMQPPAEQSSCFPEVEGLLKQGEPEQARKRLLDQFNVWQESGWLAVTEPEIIRMLGERLRDESYAFNDKQMLVFRLSGILRNKRETGGAAWDEAYRLLTSYEPIDESDREAVLAGCAKLLALASASSSELAITPELRAQMRALIERHAAMEAYERGIVDGGDNRKAIWGYLLRSYGLHTLFRVVTEGMLRETPLGDAQKVRGTFKTLALTFAPADREYRVTQNAVPHRYVVQRVLDVLEYRDGMFRRDRGYLHLVLPSIVDMLGKVLTQRTYNDYYHDVVALIHVYYASLSEGERQRQIAVSETVLDWAERYHII